MNLNYNFLFRNIGNGMKVPGRFFLENGQWFYFPLDKQDLRDKLALWDIPGLGPHDTMAFKDSAGFEMYIPANNFYTTGLTDFSGLLYYYQYFDQYIGGWDTSNVTIISNMFSGAAAFNQDISAWDTSSITQSHSAFRDATSFNQDIGGWDTSSFENMGAMFNGATSFNQDIGAWHTGNVVNMNGLFNGATVFNQDLTGWCVTNIPSLPTNFATGSALAPVNYPVWGTCPNP